MEFTKGQKKKAIGHFVYEVMMFHGTTLKLPDATDPFEKNVFIESFAIHSRNLFNFFYETRKQDDLIANDFLKNRKGFKLGITKKKTFEKSSEKSRQTSSTFNVCEKLLHLA